MHWTFHSAGSLLFGRDAVNQLGIVAATLKAKRVFIVSDAILEKAGLVARTVAPLTVAGMSVEVFTGGQPEPTIEIVRAATAAARNYAPDLVVGLGGGSNIDAAKLVAMILTHGGDPTDFTGDCRVPGSILPLICVPTTAGTGSEVSAAAVFTDTAKQIKVSCLSPHLRPAYAIVDPMLTVSCPPTVTADSGIDALTHAIEAYTAVDHDEFLARGPAGESVYQGHNPMADLMALECITLCGKFLVRAVRDGRDLEARDGMALAATLGGLAFANAGVALVHAMEYPVGGAVHVSHGAGNGLLLPFVMRFNLPGRERKFARIAECLGGDREAEQAIPLVEQLRCDIGIPLSLQTLGVTEPMLPALAEKAFAIKRLLRTNPRAATEADILGIYRAAF